MSNSSDLENCNFTNSTIELGANAYFGIYYCLTPIYFTFSCLGRVLSLFAFYIEAKKEAAYLYQFFIAIVEIFHTCAVSLFVATAYIIPQYEKDNVLWFQKCYFCLCFTYFVNSLQSVFLLCSLILSLSMTSDRIYALAKPISYSKLINHRKQQWFVFFFAVFISVVLSCSAAFGVFISENAETGAYVVSFNFFAYISGAP